MKPNKATVLVVEDEAILAMDLQARLETMGYRVADRATSGQQAVAKARELRPDLVLMDIMLPGEMDGVQAAHCIHRELDVPVIFLTGYSDRATMDRAKGVEPFGFLIKPFDDRDLDAAIEFGQRRHAALGRLRQNERWLNAILNSIGEAVVAVDQHGMIVKFNPQAEALTGCSRLEAEGRPIGQVVRLVHEVEGTPVEDLMSVSLREGRTCSRENTAALVGLNGAHVDVDETASLIHDDDGNSLGGVLILRDATARKRDEEEFRLEMIPIVLDTLGAMLVVLDPEGTIVRFNAAGQEALGFRFDQVRGLKFWALAADEEEAETMCDAFEAVRDAREPRPRHLSVCRTADGDICKVAWTHGAVREASGRLQYAICTGVPFERIF